MKSLLALVYLSLSFSAFASPAPNLQQDLSQEEEYGRILDSSAPAQEFRVHELDPLLGALRRLEDYINDFDRELDEMLARQSVDPKYHADPLRTASYQNILEMQQATKNLESEIVSIYEKLLHVARDPGSPDHDKATRALGQIDDLISSLSRDDLSQLSDLISRLQSVRAAHHARAMSPIVPVSELDEPLLQLDEDIEIQKPAPEEKHPFTPLAPSIEANGNVDGSEFPDGVWVLTFDDGPHAIYSDLLMDDLENYRDKRNPKGAAGSFFWLAQNVKLHPEVVRRAVKEGFSTNCHSWSHKDLAKVNHAELRHEVVDAVEFERKAYGRNFRFFRCPYGACISPKVPEVRKMLADMGLIHANWSVDSLDWKLKNAKRTFNFVIKQMKIKKHGIILMHDIHPFSVEAAEMVLEWIKEQNDSGQDQIELMTIDDAVDLYNGRQISIGSAQ